MFKCFFESIFDAMRLWRLPSDEREFLTSNLTRLKAISSELKTNLPPKNSNSAKASLFEDLPGATSERRSVGHWHMLSAAAAREERFKRIERSYDQDFRQAIDIDLDSLISEKCSHKALSTFVNRDTRAQVSSNEEELSHKSKSSEDEAEFQSLLFKMANEGDASARVSVASNRSAPVAAKWKLCKDASADVRLALVQNDNLPLSILRAMAHDNDERVKRKALSRLALQASPLVDEIDSKVS